ncbi:MAG TPA: biopolymer transporter ExbD [Tepidisphaeraceae bacterium]|jgi:biopolymer transport protein ExbD
MKLKGSKQVHYEAGPDMTPLVDVVMVLLIFLMMVGKFGGGTRYLASDQPITSAGASAKPVDPNEVPKEPVIINVSAPTADQYRAFVGQISTSNDDELAAKLAGLLKGMEGAGRKVDDIQVYIKPARNVRYALVVRVYTAVLKSKFTKVGFQTSEG